MRSATSSGCGTNRAAKTATRSCTINLTKIQPGMEHNFDQHITDGDDVGAYDFGSIMHYPRDAFSVDGSDTITPTVAGAVIGQRIALTAGDIAAANSFCPKPLKEAARTSSRTWAKTGSRRSRRSGKTSASTRRKEQIRDTLKEQIKDVVKDRKEPILDPRKAPFEGPRPPLVRGHPAAGSADRSPSPLRRRTRRRRQGQPGRPGSSSGTIGELDATLEALAEQLSQVEGDRAALQAQYDELAALLEQTLAEHDQASE